jgi:hypothetical protein
MVDAVENQVQGVALFFWSKVAPTIAPVSDPAMVLNNSVMEIF